MLIAFQLVAGLPGCQAARLLVQGQLNNWLQLHLPLAPVLAAQEKGKCWQQEGDLCLSELDEESGRLGRNELAEQLVKGSLFCSQPVEGRELTRTTMTRANSC